MDETGSTLRLDAAGRSDIGQVPRRSGRGEEDSQCVRRLARTAEQGVEKWLCAVADGVGQRKGGSVASAQALNMLEDAVERYARWGPGYLEQFDEGMRTAEDYHRFVAQCVDSQLKQNAENNVSITGMATTLTAAYCEGTTAHLLHVGDSRAYRLDARGGVLTQLTRDDAPAPGEEFDPEPTAALGALTDPSSVHAESIELLEGDILLLCTDGLWREVDDPLLVRALRGSATPAAAVDRLIRIANRRGGRGNIAAVVLHVGSPPVQEDPELDKEFPLSAGLAGERGAQRPMPLPRSEEPASVEAPPPAAPVPPSAPPTPSAPAEVPPTPAPAVGPVLAPPPPLPTPPLDLPGLGLETPPDAPAVEPAPETADLFGPSSPRAALSRTEPPGVPGGGSFWAGVAVGASVVLVIGLVAFGVRWALSARKPVETATGTQAVKVAEIPGEPFQYALWMWEKTISSAPATVQYLTHRDLETGEDQYANLSPIATGGQPGPATMFLEDDGLCLYLRIKFALNAKTGEPVGDMLTFKFVPEQETGDRVVVRPGSAVPAADPKNGTIEVTGEAATKVRLTALGTEELIRGGSETVMLKKRQDGRYAGIFRNVPRGHYSVVAGTSVNTASITDQRPRTEVAIAAP